MKRKDLITKLINEGFSAKTLVGLTDKQLRVLADRVLAEQTQTPVLNIPSTNVGQITAAKNKKQTFVTYEGEMSENQSKQEKKKEEKDIVMKRLEHKIEHCTDKDKLKDYVELVKRINNGKIPESIQSHLSKKEKPEKVEADEQIKEQDAKTWVKKLVENKYLTSKNEILGLIEAKLKEQKWEDDDDVQTLDEPDLSDPTNMAASPEKEIEIEPDVKPGKPRTEPDIDPDDPFRDPKPGIDPGPKASADNDNGEISASVAKEKIIDLMKKML